MSAAQVLRSACPRCKAVLRIPAAWLNQPLKCRNCGQLFQSRLPQPIPPAGVP
jgi:hypothetical protein